MEPNLNWPHVEYLRHQTQWDGVNHPGDVEELIGHIDAMRETLRRVLARLDLEPTEAVFPCSAMRPEIRMAAGDNDNYQGEAGNG